MTTVYLLIEESERELDSRLLIAAGLLRRGIRVVVGNQWMVTRNIARFPKGLVVFKGNNAVQTAEMRRLKAAGFAIASIEEEVFGMRRGADLASCYDPRVANACDLFIAQGMDHSEMLIEDFGVPPDRIAVAGNPRADLLRPEWIARLTARTAEIRDRYGDFVLINTNYPGVNPIEGDALWIFRLLVQTGLLPDNDHGRREMASLCGWERRNLRQIVQFIDQFTRSEPDRPVVVRPHPREKIERWTEGLAGFPSVHVIRDGSHVPWTASARLLVHTSCTTGLEAFLMGTPSISLVSGNERWETAFSSNLVSETAADPVAAVETARRCIGMPSPEDRPARLAALRPYLRHEPDITAASLVAEAFADWIDAQHLTGEAFDDSSDLKVASIAARSLLKSSLSGIDVGQRMATLPFGLATEAKVVWMNTDAVRLEPVT